MEKIPMEWVDKIFLCMDKFYGERWSKKFNTEHSESYYKTIWCNGLTGLTYYQIKSALILCKKEAEESWNFPPHVIEFFSYAKGLSEPYVNPKLNKVEKYSPAVVNSCLDQMRSVLGVRPVNLDREKRAFL